MGKIVTIDLSVEELREVKKAVGYVLDDVKWSQTHIKTALSNALFKLQKEYEKAIS